MAERRMFSKDITESDAFLDMPLSTQALYFHLCMYADDDGFLGGYRKIMRMCGATQNEYDLLLAKNFIIQFDDGIVVIKHWLMHNYLRKDRYKPTSYTKEKAMLFVKENKAYTLDDTQGLPLGIPMVDAGKDSIGKDSKGKKSKSKKIEKPRTPLEVAIDEFKKHRKQLKKPMTDRAVVLFVNKLNGMGDTDEEKIALIDQAIERGWQSVYPLKEEGKKESDEERKEAIRRMMEE